MSNINKKLIDHLISLARFEIGSDKEKEEILEDFKEIVTYFDSLKRVNVKGIEPAIGGAFEKNVLRDDDSENDRLERKGIEKHFPENDNGYNKVPTVF